MPNSTLQQPATLREPAPCPSIKVLVVEDDPRMLRSIQDVFRYFGFDVMTAADGRDALHLALEYDFDIVVCDIRLPGLDGIAVTRALNNAPDGPRVVLITAYPQWQVIDRAREAGAAAVMTKPLILAKLAEKICEVLSDGSTP